MSTYNDGPEGASSINFNGIATTFTGTPSVGGLLSCDTSSSVKVLAVGTSGQLLQSNGAADPSYTSTPSISSITLATPLSIADGGTASSAALTNNRLLWSAGGAITEATQLTDGQLFVGSTGAAPVATTITAGSNISITNGAGSLTITSTATGTPGGSSKSVQFNNGGAFDGSPNFGWDDTNNVVVISGTAGQTRMKVGGSANPANAVVYIETDTAANNEGQRVYFNSGSSKTSAYIAHGFDTNAPYITVTDADDDAPYITFNTIGTGTFTAPLYSSVFGARGGPGTRTSGTDSGFAWYIGTNVTPASLIGVTPVMSLDSTWLGLPKGSSGTRPAAPLIGTIRENTDTSRIEMYDATTTPTQWTSLTGILTKSTVPLTLTLATSTQIFNYSVAGGTLLTDGILRLRAAGDWLNASGATRACTLLVTYGVTIMWRATTPSLANGARTGWSVDLYLAAANSTNAQTLNGIVDFGPVGVPTTGVTGTLTATKFATGNVYGTAAINSATQNLFTMSASFNAANPGFTIRWFTLEKL